MAGDWIKLEHTTPDKPEVIRMATMLRIDQDAVTGKLLRLWIWADQNSIDGEAVLVTHAFIDRFTGCKKFSAALLAVGWLAGEDGNLSLPNFDRHNGESAKARGESARRMAKSRANKKEHLLPESAPDVAEKLQQKAQPEKRREEVIERENAGATLAEWAERIVKAYPRQDAPSECRQLVLDCLQSEVDPTTPDDMLAKVKLCTEFIAQWPTGHANGMVPFARNFFGRESWRSPEAYSTPPRAKGTNRIPQAVPVVGMGTGFGVKFLNGGTHAHE